MGLGAWIGIRIPEVVWEAMCGSLCCCGRYRLEAARPECWESVLDMGIPLSHACAGRSSPNLTTIFSPLYFYAFLLSWWSVRKSEWSRESESVTSAIVANAVLWIGFPLFRWKIKVLPGEALRICDLWLVLQRFFQQSLITKGENQVVQTDP